MARSLVALSLRTRIPFTDLLREDPQTIVTYAEILEEQDKAAREA